MPAGEDTACGLAGGRDRRTPGMKRQDIHECGYLRIVKRGVSAHPLSGLRSRAALDLTGSQGGLSR